MKSLFALSVIGFAACFGVAYAQEEGQEAGQDIAEQTPEPSKEKSRMETNETPAPASESVNEAGKEIKASTCPIIGDKSKKMYYVRGSKHYEKLLKSKNKKDKENRECFTSDKHAEDAGFQKGK